MGPAQPFSLKTSTPRGGPTHQAVARGWVEKVNVPASRACWTKPGKCAYPCAESGYPATKIVCVCKRDVKSFCLGSKACFVAKINQCLFLGVMGSWIQSSQRQRALSFWVTNKVFKKKKKHKSNQKLGTQVFFTSHIWVRKPKGKLLISRVPRSRENYIVDGWTI